METAYLDALKNASQALARISELDEVVTTEGELAVEYQQSVWAPKTKKIYIVSCVVGAVIGSVLGIFGSIFNIFGDDPEANSLKMGIGLGAFAGMALGMFAGTFIHYGSFFKMNSGKSKKPEHVHHVRLVKAQKETYSLIKNVWKPNLAILKRYARKNNVGEYGQLCDSLIRADSWVKTLTLKAQTAKLAKQNAADSMRTALKFAAVAVAVTGVAVVAMSGMVGAASQGVGGTRYRVTYEDGTTSYETR